MTLELNSCKMDVHSSWLELMINNKELLDIIINKIQDNYTPDKDNIFKFAKTDLDKTNVIILGQDPYPQPGAATGRSFEVSYLKSWSEKIPQSSIRNIVKVLYKSYYGELVSFKQIRDKIAKGEFPLVSPDQLFHSWEGQGVLMLNTSLTCRVGEPNSHKTIWSPFTAKMLAYISDRKPNASWFLWGNQAQDYATLIKSGTVYRTNHPMMLNPKKAADLSNSSCFTETQNSYHIHWLG